MSKKNVIETIGALSAIVAAVCTVAWCLLNVIEAVRWKRESADYADDGDLEDCSANWR